MKNKLTDLFEHPPWTQPNSGVDVAIRGLINELIDRHKAREEAIPLTQAQKEELERKYRNAEQSRTYAQKLMYSIARALELECLDTAVMMADMKKINRAAEKINANRDIHDLGRGRIYVKTPKDIQKFYKLLNGKNHHTHINGATHNASIIPGSISDYLKEPRKSGFAGALLFDLEVDVGKNRHGTFEVQIMPEDYKEAYDQSHRLYDMIRIFQDIQKASEHLLTPDYRYVLENLVRANAALFDEFAIRTKFDSLRKEPVHFITEEESDDGYDVLEKIRAELDLRRKDNNPWIKETMEATTYAKSSLGNLEIAGRRQKKITQQANDVHGMTLASS